MPHLPAFYKGCFIYISVHSCNGQMCYTALLTVKSDIVDDLFYRAIVYNGQLSQVNASLLKMSVFIFRFILCLLY